MNQENLNKNRWTNKILWSEVQDSKKEEDLHQTRTSKVYIKQPVSYLINQGLKDKLIKKYYRDHLKNKYNIYQKD